MRVLLVNPPTLNRWKPITESLAEASQTPYYSRILSDDSHLLHGCSTLPGEHLGLQSLAASLRANAHKVEIVDACGQFHRSLRETADSLGPLGDFDLVGLTGPTDVMGEVRWLINYARGMDYSGPIVIGNDHASLNAQRELEATQGLDYVLRGEAEKSLVALVSVIEGQGAHEDVPGLSWRTTDRIRHNSQAPEALDLSMMPTPVRDKTASVIANGMAASMFTKRGCPYGCAHCTTGQVAGSPEANLGPRWRAKTPSTAIAEFQELASTFGLGHVTIVDDLFVAKDARSRAWAQEFGELLIEARNTVTFMIDCRVDSLDVQLAKTLYQAGLRRVFIGAESGASVALSGLNKRYLGVSPTKQILMIHELGIDAILEFIFLTPGDTLETLPQSVGFLESLHAGDYRLFTQRARVYPGSLLESQVRRDTMLTGRFPFYGFDYSDRQMKLVAHVVARAVRELGDYVEEHSPLSAEVEAGLFSSFARGIRRLCSEPPAPDASDECIEQLISCLVADCSLGLPQ